jgi:hypothetical protein
VAGFGRESRLVIERPFSPAFIGRQTGRNATQHGVQDIRDTSIDWL